MSTIKLHNLVGMDIELYNSMAVPNHPSPQSAQWTGTAIELLDSMARPGHGDVNTFMTSHEVAEKGRAEGRANEPRNSKTKRSGGLIPGSESVQGTSPPSWLTCLPSWSLYQSGEEIDLLTELVSTSLPAGTGTSSVWRSKSLPGWYMYQLSEEVNLLAGLVHVPVFQAAVCKHMLHHSSADGGWDLVKRPAHRAGTCTSPGSRSSCLLDWHRYQLCEQLGKQVLDLPAGLVQAWQAGTRPARWTGTSLESREICLLPVTGYTVRKGWLHQDSNPDPTGGLISLQEPALPLSYKAASRQIQMA
ncbi:hypothetical protein PCASD_18879 [Puccinia coronata f. sp. avenae]|uniref:Uncharacterized protein n=1 Tax=Puccinia coronata f. sp. avenae TaxID=200324 RepID=A0A2N5UCU7_9BASI|nr:hypothetical protein PCASD_18879 [Puccinia coronata f. sp. avenae]